MLRPPRRRSKLTAPDFERLARTPCPVASLASSGISAFELGLGILVFQESLSGAAKDAGELRPGVGRAHVDDPNSLDAGPRRLDAEEARGLAALHAAPELLLGGEQEVLIERIGRIW